MIDSVADKSRSKILVLSPHRDDAAFSCGLLLSALITRDCQLTICNVFTTSDYAPYLASDRTERVKQVTLKRESEDLAFGSLLLDTTGAKPNSLRFVDLNLKDAPLRRNIATEDVLKTCVDGAEELELAEQFRSLKEMYDLVLAPLAIGAHTDHLLVRNAAHRAFLESKVLFYEDLPYVCRLERMVIPADASLAPWLSPAVEVGVKRAHALCYPSQVAAEVADEMEAYAASLGNRERYYAEPNAIRVMESLLHN